MPEKTLPPSYIQAFKQADEKFPDAFELIGDVLLVREIPPKEQKTKSGLIVAPMGLKQMDGIEANRPCWVEVLKIGSGYYDEETGETVPLDTKPGDIIMVGRLAVGWLSVLGTLTSTPENNLGKVRESEIQARFRGQEIHDKYFEALEAELAA